MKTKRKQFSPHIYAEWGELFECLNVEQKADILMAITQFPNYEPVNNPIWNFIKSQLQKDYECFVEKCEKNGQISRNYWKNKSKKKEHHLISEEQNINRTISNEIEQYPKRITNNELQLTNNELTNNELQKQEKKLKEKEPTIEDLFLIFYEKYPNKKSKQKALLSFNKALKITTFEKIMHGLDNYIKDIEQKKTEKKYIKHPTTWLNQGCWEDEYEITEDKSNLLDMANSILGDTQDEQK